MGPNLNLGPANLIQVGPIAHALFALARGDPHPKSGIGLSLSGTEFAVVFIILGLCYLGVLLFADSVKVRVGIGAIVALHLIFLVAPPLLSSDIFNSAGTIFASRSHSP